jgi:hypothetical protein
LGLARQLNPISLGLVTQPLGVSKKTEKPIKPRKLEKNKQKKPNHEKKQIKPIRIF